MKITGVHPSGAKAEIYPHSSGSGTYMLICECPAGYEIHREWYWSVNQAKQIARRESFTVFDLLDNKHKGRWKWTEEQ